MKAAPEMAVSSAEDAGSVNQLARSTIDTDSFAGLLESGEYSDMTLKISNGKAFALHRSIICTQSKPLAALIDGNSPATTKAIDLIEDDPQSVEYMIKYLYTSDYDHAEQDVEQKNEQNDEQDAKTDSSLTESALWVHTKVYDLAGKYEIAGLKTLAHEKYINALSSEGLTTAFTDHLRIVVNEAPGGDRKLRDSALAFVGQEYRELAKDEEFVEFFKEDKNFAVEVLRVIASIPLVLLTKPCKRCGRGEKYVRTRSANEIFNIPSQPERYRCEYCFTNFN